MDCRPARTEKGRRITRPGRPFRQILALPSYIRSLGALSALGIGGHRPRREDLTGMRFGAHPRPSQASLEQALSPSAEFEFNRQDITITVPASFDAAAQRLTLTAARKRVFRKPFVCLKNRKPHFTAGWSSTISATDCRSKLPNQNAGAHHLLVIDIGGGTSDFSLFEFRSDARSPAPEIKRVAVGDHILLGGDNVDLAIAHFLEPQLIGERGQLSGTQWDDLVARCRDLKENALSSARRAGRALPCLACPAGVRPGHGCRIRPS